MAGCLLVSCLLTGCEGAIDPTKKTDEGLNTLSFRLDGETISAGGRAPDWVRGVFSIFNPHREEDDAQEPVQRVFSGYNASRDTLWIQASSLNLNAWDISMLSIAFPSRAMREGATIAFRDLRAEMPYLSGYERDASFPQGYAFTPLHRTAEFLDGSLYIRSWDEDKGILSGEFQFKVRMVSEGIANETFHPGTGKDAQHPDTYEVRPRETVELSISRGTFDVNYLR
jgi:hypothetical protein